MSSATITVYATGSNACKALRGEQFVAMLYPPTGWRKKPRVAVTVSSAEWMFGFEDAVTQGIVNVHPKPVPKRKLPT